MFHQFIHLFNKYNLLYLYTDSLNPKNKKLPSRCSQILIVGPRAPEKPWSNLKMWFGWNPVYGVKPHKKGGGVGCKDHP